MKTIKSIFKNSIASVIICCALILFSIITGYSQSGVDKYVNQTWSADLKEDKAFISDLLKTQDEKMFTIQSNKSGKKVISSVSSDLVAGEAHELEFDYNSEKLRVTDVITLKNKLICIGANATNMTFNYNVYVFTIDNKTFEINGDVKTFTAIKKKQFYLGMPIDFAKSKDESKLLVLDYALENDFHFTVYNENLDALYSKDVKVTNEEGKFSYGGNLIANDGRVIVYGDVVVEKDKSKNFDGDRYPYVISIDANGKVVQQKIKLQDKFISAYSLLINKSNNLVYAGFYSVAGYWHTHGAFAVTLDKDLKIINEKTTDIASTIKTNILGPDHQDQGLGALPIQYFDEQENGDLVMVGQNTSTNSSATTTRTTLPSGGGGSNTFTSHSNVTTYLCHEAVVIRFSPDCSIKSAAVVPILQESTGFLKIGCAIQTINDKTYIIYNDNPKNEKIFEQYKMEKYDGRDASAEIILAVVNAQGIVEKFPLIPKKDLGVTFVPGSSLSLSDEKFLIYGDHGSTYRLGQLTFK